MEHLERGAILSIKATLNPKNARGLERLIVVERLAALDRSFTMSELDEHEVDVVRWGWNREIVVIVSAGPLRYEVTAFGRMLVERGLEKLREMEHEQESVDVT